MQSSRYYVCLSDDVRVVPFFSNQTSIVYMCVLGLTSPKKCNNFAQFAQEEKNALIGMIFSKTKSSSSLDESDWLMIKV